MEIIHVQLSNEAAKVIVLEVLWKNLVRELIYLLYDKTISVGVPRNNIVRGAVLHDIEGF